jgi:hypothetical protein
MFIVRCSEFFFLLSICLRVSRSAIAFSIKIDDVKRVGSRIKKEKYIE